MDKYKCKKTSALTNPLKRFSEET